MIDDQITRPADRLIALEQVIKDWAKKTKGLLRQRLIALNLDERRAAKRGTSRLRAYTTRTGTTVLVRDQYLIESLGSAVRRRGLEVEAVSISFARQGIYLEIGVGKNRKKGSGKESPKPWINVIIPSAVEELATVLSEEYADLAAGELKINIPGVYSTRITI